MRINGIRKDYSPRVNSLMTQTYSSCLNREESQLITLSCFFVFLCLHSSVLCVKSKVSMFQEKPAYYVPPDTQRDMAFSSTSDCSNLPVPSNTKPPYLMRNHTGHLLG